MVCEACLWSNYSFGDPMVITTIITPFSQKLKMSLIGMVKLAIQTAIGKCEEGELRGGSCLGGGS